MTRSTGMPARIMVLSCLVNRISSSGLTCFISPDSRLSRPAAPVSSRSPSGARPRPASSSFAWSSDWASITPATVLPCSFTAS